MFFTGLSVRNFVVCIFGDRPANPLVLRLLFVETCYRVEIKGFGKESGMMIIENVVSLIIGNLILNFQNILHYIQSFSHP